MDNKSLGKLKKKGKLILNKYFCAKRVKKKSRMKDIRWNCYFPVICVTRENRMSFKLHNFFFVLLLKQTEDLLD